MLSFDYALYDDHRLTLLPSAHLAASIGLLTLAGTWARRHGTGGHVPRVQVERLGCSMRAAQQLVSSGFWREDGADFWFVDWSEGDSVRGHSPDASADKRAADAERKRLKRAAVRGHSPDASADISDVSADSEGFVRGQGDKGGSEISDSELSSPSVSPSPLGSSSQLAGCNAGAGARDGDEKPNPSRFRFELEELVRAEFVERRVTPPKAAASQWRDACQTVQDALDMGLYADGRDAMRAFAPRIVDECVTLKGKLGLALQQATLGAQLKPVAPRRQLSELAQLALARGGGT